MSIGGAEMLLSAVLPKWFIRRRTQALTIASAGSGAGPLIFPLLVSAVIDGWGWRAGWLALGGAAFLILVPLAFTVRTRPEDMGLEPDGDPAPLTASGVRRVEERSFTRGEAVRQPSFWLMNVSGALFIMGVTGLQTSSMNRSPSSQRPRWLGAPSASHGTSPTWTECRRWIRISQWRVPG